MKPFRNTFTLLALALVVGGCSTRPYQTDYDFDSTASFDSYKTWSWISDSPLILSDDTPSNPMLESRIMDHVDRAMTSKGFRKVDSPEEADLTVSFTVGARDRIRVTSYPVTYQIGFSRWGRGWGYRYYFPPLHENVEVREYTEGQLAIDIFDAETRRPIYHGFATGNVSKRRSREEREQILHDAVRDIMLTFPPS